MCIFFKRTLKFNFILFSLLSFMLFNLVNLFAQDEETGLEEMFAIFTEEEIVVSALKKPRTVLKSPAIMSVITAKQIKQMGLRTLVDVLGTAPSPDKFINRGGARTIGVEAEIKADFGSDNYAYVNYTFQKAADTDRNRLPDVPVHKANLGMNVGFWKYANANLHTFISGPRPREDGDTRADLPSYALVNLTLIGRNFMDNFEIKGSVFNLFDKSYDDPAPKDTVTTDYPQPGRSFVVELRYQF